MITCRDCGHRNFGAIYCARCGGELFRKSRKAEPDLLGGLGFEALIRRVVRVK